MSPGEFMRCSSGARGIETKNKRPLIWHVDKLTVAPRAGIEGAGNNSWKRALPMRSTITTSNMRANDDSGGSKSRIT